MLPAPDIVRPPSSSFKPRLAAGAWHPTRTTTRLHAGMVRLTPDASTETSSKLFGTTWFGSSSEFSARGSSALSTDALAVCAAGYYAYEAGACTPASCLAPWANTRILEASVCRAATQLV